MYMFEIFLGKSLNTVSLSKCSDGENIDSNSLVTVVHQETNQTSNDPNCNRFADNKDNIETGGKPQAGFESNCLPQEELDCSSSDNEVNLNKECSISEVLHKFWITDEIPDIQNEEEADNLISSNLCANQIEDETFQERNKAPMQVPIVTTNNLIHDSHIQRVFKNLNYVTIFRDDFNQKVIASPINKPEDTKKFELEMEDKVSRSKSFEFDFKRFNNSSINDTTPDWGYERYQSLFL